MLAERHGIDRRSAFRFVSSIVNVIQKGLEKDRLVKIKGLGTFKIIDVDARESVNVNTGERLVIEGHPKLTFLPDASMKELVNKPFSIFETVVLNDGVSFDDIQTDEGEDAAEANDPVPMEKTADVEDADIEKSTEMSEPLEELESQEDTREPEPLETTEEPEPLETTSEPEPLETPEEPETSEPSEMLEITEEPDSPVAEEERTPFVTLPEENDVVSPAESLESPKPVSSFVQAEEEDHEGEYDDDERPAASKGYLMWTIGALLLAVGFAAGFFVGRYTASPTVVEVIDTEVEKPAEEKTDTLAAVSATEEVKESDVTSQETPQPVASETQTGVPEWEKYNDMDPRTRNGYYYIMGLDRIEKAREGDNSRRIAKRVFGAVEMACYIEVYNGIDGSTVLEKDAEIRVPKIESKKSVRRRMQQQNK